MFLALGSGRRVGRPAKQGAQVCPAGGPRRGAWAPASTSADAVHTASPLHHLVTAGKAPVTEALGDVLWLGVWQSLCLCLPFSKPFACDQWVEGAPRRPPPPPGPSEPDLSLLRGLSPSRDPPPVAAAETFARKEEARWLLPRPTGLTGRAEKGTWVLASLPSPCSSRARPPT